MEFLVTTLLLLMCGYSLGKPNMEENKNLASTGRIVGGRKTRHGNYPFMVSLNDEYNGKYYHGCGGSILNHHWIITAAHCIDNPDDPSTIVAIVGMHSLANKKAPSLQRLKISKIVMHPRYDDVYYFNDIALLRTKTPIDIKGSGGYVKPIRLPRPDTEPSGYAMVIGWGHTAEDTSNSNHLLEVRVPIIRRDKCNAVYDHNRKDKVDRIIKSMMCAGQDSKDSCQNDSGGPLFQEDSKLVPTIIGIVSFGRGCGRPGYPGVYTKVSAYTRWIANIIRK